MPALRKACDSAAAARRSSPGSELVEHLDDRHPRAQLREDRGELAADHPAADDRQALGQVVELEQLVAGHDARVGDVEHGQHGRSRAGGHDDRVGRISSRRSPSPPADAHRVGVDQPPAAGDDLDLARP